MDSCRPLVKGEDLIIICGDKLNIRVGLERGALAPCLIEAGDERFDVPRFVPVAGFELVFLTVEILLTTRERGSLAEFKAGIDPPR